MSYENELYSYEYPISWERRNKNYLKKVYNRKNIAEFIVPVVFRLRFYTSSGTIISDDTYTPTNHTIKFPTPEIIEGKVFDGWELYYNDSYHYITQENFEALKSAVVDGYEDIKLTAHYEDIIND